MSLWQIGASTSGHYIPGENLFKAYNTAGLKAMEISIDYNMQGLSKVKDVLKELNPKKIKKLAEENEVELWSFHLPFDHSEINPASFDKNVRKNTVELDAELIKSAAEAGAKIAVLHASGEPIKNIDRQKSMKYAKESIFLINEAAKMNGILLAVENLPRTCLGKNSSEISELIQVDDSIRVCLDVNHLLEESHVNFIKNTGDKIVTLHISDYDFKDERHWLPGNGSIDWPELIELLKSINYSGPFMNEIRAVPDNNNGKITFSQIKKANDIILK